jgi:hypothetical protein
MLSTRRLNVAVARGIRAGLAVVAALLAVPGVVSAGKLSWLDDVVQQVIAEAKVSRRGLVRGGEGARGEIQRTGRLFVSHGADEGLEQLVRRSEDLTRASRRFERPADALLQARFVRLVKEDPKVLKTFATLAPAEKRLVVELGEGAQQLARRYPAEAEAMVRRLGPEGLTAMRVFGDDVAETLVKEGPEGLSVLRKAGRGGWDFFTRQVLPHKKKLAAAGVLAAFLANPDKFVDYAGKATELAVREFARAGVQLASALGAGTARGLEGQVAEGLAALGLNHPALRYLVMGLAALAVLLCTCVIVGLPLRWVLRPIAWPWSLLGLLRRTSKIASAE